jgi:hypothetical protein
MAVQVRARGEAMALPGWLDAGRRAGAARVHSDMSGRPVQMTTHHAGGHVVHADAKWNNGNSPVGLALAVRMHEQGKATDHVVHSAGETCGHCPA